MTRVAKHFLRLDRNRKPRMKTLWHPGYQFPSFAIFSHETCHVTIINGYVTRRPQDILLGKKIHLVLAVLAKDIANQSYSLNTHWTYARP